MPLRITPRVFADYKRTIALHPPETVALLGGRLDEPDLVTEFRFCPPGTVDGAMSASSAHVRMDADLMNWIITQEWAPNGLYALGVWHSHPQGVTRPSGWGGDLGAFDNFLESEAAIEAGWDTVLAPITTFDGDGSDQIHGWTFSRGSQAADPAEVLIHTQGQDLSVPAFEAFLGGVTSDAGVAQPIDRISHASRTIERLIEAKDGIGTGAGLNIWQRLRARRMFSRYAMAEFDVLMAGVSLDLVGDGGSHGG